jgi:leucine dehydrogenase
MSLTTDLAERDFEQLVLCRDPGVGLRSVIAVHDTTLGPALGGIRMRRYPNHDAAIADAMNLAQAMTYKAALAGLPLGGGKSVIDADPTTVARAELVTAHGRYIAALSGRYIPGVDMGVTVADLNLVARTGARVSSQRRDPSWYTARGVVRSIEAAAGWAGVPVGRVAVQGLGNVGRHVVDLLLATGAEVVVADLDDARVAGAVAVGAQAAPATEILTADVDVLCPCAAGGVVTESLLDELKARLVVGAANNVLAADEIAGVLAERGVVHVPDFVANAGGLMACEAELRGTDEGLLAKVDRIADTALAVLRRDASSRTGTVAVAVGMAQERLAARRAERPTFVTG